MGGDHGGCSWSQTEEAASDQGSSGQGLEGKDPGHAVDCPWVCRPLCAVVSLSRSWEKGMGLTVAVLSSSFCEEIVTISGPHQQVPTRWFLIHSEQGKVCGAEGGKA